MYYLIQSEVEVEGTTYTTYGIRKGDFIVEDISTDRWKVMNFISLLNDAGEISETHLMDIIEDLLL